jgi:hypothetical protein
MLKRVFLASALLLCIPLAARAQPAGDDEEARAAAARRLIEATGAGQLGIQAMDTMMSSMKKAHPTVPEAFWTEFRAEIRAEDLVDLVVPIYVKYLTLDDMQQLATFYESPLGKKLRQVQPAIVQDSMSAGQQWGRDLALRVIQRLKDRGYAPKANTD